MISSASMSRPSRLARSSTVASAVTTSPPGFGYRVQGSAAGGVQLDERLGIGDDEAVLGLSHDGDEVVLERRHERAVEGHRGLGGHAVADATDDAPRGLRPVAAVAD